MTQRARRIEGVAIGLQLNALAEAMLRQRLRRVHPTWSTTAIEEEVTRWRLERPGAPHGDAVGRVGAWPRRPRR